MKTGQEALLEIEGTYKVNLSAISEFVSIPKSTLYYISKGTTRSCKEQNAIIIRNLLEELKQNPDHELLKRKRNKIKNPLVAGQIKSAFEEGKTKTKWEKSESKKLHDEMI